MKIKNISMTLVAIVLLHSAIYAHKNKIKIHLFDNATISSGMQFSQLFSLSSKQVFTSYFSRNVGFRTKYLNFGLSQQEYFSPDNIDGYNFKQRILSNGLYAGFTYPISNKFEIGASFQRSQLQYVAPYTQFNRNGGWFDFADYRADYDLNNEIEIKSSYQICDYLWINASAKFGFESETFGKNYAGYALGIQATFPKIVIYDTNIDSLSFKKKRKIYGFIGTTRILKDAKNYNHRLNENIVNDVTTNLSEVSFNYDVYQPVAMVCAGAMSKGGNLFYVNFGKHETFTKDKFYDATNALDLFIDESYLYHSKSQYIGIAADINPFSFSKKTSQLRLFPVVSLFGHYSHREQQSVRNVNSDLPNTNTEKVLHMDIKANVLYYGTAFGIGAKVGRLYGNFKVDLAKGNMVNMEATRKYKTYSNSNPYNFISEENIEDLNLKGSLKMNQHIGEGFLGHALLKESAFTIGILF